MTTIRISAAGKCAPTLTIGKRGENLATEVRFDFSAWAEEFGEGRVELYARRCGDENAYPVTVTVDGTTAVWTLTATDTHVVGYGTAEYVWVAGETVVKSVVFGTFVEPDIGAPTDTPPEPYESWLDTLTELAADTQDNAERAETAQGKAEDAQEAAEAAQAAAEAVLESIPEDYSAMSADVALMKSDLGVLREDFDESDGVPAWYGPDQTLAKDGTATSGIGVKSHQGIYVFNGAKTTNPTQTWRCKLDGTLARSATTSYMSWSRDLHLQAGHRYTVRVEALTELPVIENQGDLGVGMFITSTVARHYFLNGAKGEFTYTPTDTVDALLFLFYSHAIVLDDFTVRVTVRDLTAAQAHYGLDEALTGKADAAFVRTFNWAGEFGTSTYEFGWQQGYYNSSGQTGSSTDNRCLRTLAKKKYRAKAGETKIVFTAPEGFHARISEFDANGTFVRNIGDYSSGDRRQEAEVTEGYQYAFCYGRYTDAWPEITAELVATIGGVVYRSTESRDEEQDRRLDALENTTALPEYYGSYVEDRIDAVTDIQRTLPVRNDAFLFVTDYHHRTNQKHSLAMLKAIGRQTGIRKIFFAGDAGGSEGTGDVQRLHALQNSAAVWSDLADCGEEFWGALGNHEYISGAVFDIGTMFGAYLDRFTRRCDGMDTVSGSYYIDDPVKKIRYYFMQFGSSMSATGADWMGRTLETIGDGWWVAIVAHHGFIPGTASKAEYDGVEIDTSTGSHILAKTETRILAAYQEHTTLDVTLAGTTYSYDFTGSSGGGAIGVFCGHYHHGTLFSRDHEENIWGIPVWRGSTDCMKAASVAMPTEEGKVPWYWENGIIGGTKVPRERGTTSEQCVYAVNIDLEAKKVYITAFGGDHDWEFDFGPAVASTADSEG